MMTFRKPVVAGCLFLLFSFSNLLVYAQKMPPWIDESNKASQAYSNVIEMNDDVREAVSVPPGSRMSRQERKKKLQRFVTEVEAFGEALRVMTHKYTEYLDSVAKVNATCGVNLDRCLQRKRSTFSWICDGVIEDCNEGVGTLKDYSRVLGARLDEAESISNRVNADAKIATHSIDRILLLEAANAVKKETKKGEIVLEKAEKRLNAFGN